MSGEVRRPHAAPPEEVRRALMIGCAERPTTLLTRALPGGVFGNQGLTELFFANFEGQRRQDQRRFTCESATAAPTPTPVSTAAPTPTPVPVEFSLVVTSRVCTVRERYPDGSATYWVDVSGSASGDVEAVLGVGTSAATARSASWGCSST